MQEKKSKFYKYLIALIAWFALALQLFLLIDNGPANGMNPWQATWRFLSFFTILTNLLVAVSISWILIKPLSAIGLFFNRISVTTAIALYIFIVGIVYNLLLRQTWQPEGWQKLADELLHVVIPLLYLGYWLLFMPKARLKWSYSLTWLIYPGLYLGYALLRGYMENFYPYPFINVNEIGYKSVFLNAGGLLMVFIAIGLLFIATVNLRGKIMPRSA